MSEQIAELCIWMTTYTEIEVVAISLGCLALACLLGFIGVRLVQVMILGEGDGYDDGYDE